MGLLDLMNSDTGVLGAALLAAGAPQATRPNFGQGLLSAMGTAQQWKAQEEERRQRAAMQALQMQAMQQQAAEREQQMRQQQTDQSAIRGLFQPLQGPTQDGSQVQRRFDPGTLFAAGASPQAVQQAGQMYQMANPQAQRPEFKVVGGNLVRINPDNTVAEAYREPQKPQAEDEFTKALKAAGIDPASPQGRQFALQHLQKMATHQPATQVNVDRAPQGYRWEAPGKLAPIPGGPADKLPEKQQATVVGVQSLRDGIAEYRAQLAKHSTLDVIRPDARAEMGTKYKNMMLQAKEAYNLGVLNGPDMEILQSVVTDPMSISGMMTSKRALDRQAAELDRIMNKIASNASQIRPRGGDPASAPVTVDFGSLK